MSIQAILFVNTFSQTHAEEAATREQHNFSLASHLEPDPYVRTTATNGDNDAKTETPTAAKIAPGADENDDDPAGDEHK